MIANHLAVPGLRMSHIELPRALEDYFAFAETEPTRKGRRFSITLPYLDGTRLDRLQWWYHVNTAQAKIIGETGVAAIRAQAVERFRRHIEQWLANTGQRLQGDGPIPQLGALRASATAPATTEAAAEEPQPNVLPWPVEKVANG